MRLFAVQLTLVLVARPAAAYQFVTPDSLPSDSLSESCVDALVTDVDCVQTVAAFGLREPVPAEYLEDACTSQCLAALGEWETTAKTACGKDDVFPIDESEATLELASSIPTTVYYHFNRTCIQDGKRWCHVVANDASEGTTKPAQTPIDMCDDCIIKQMQFQAGSPLYDGFELQESYRSLTQSCSKTGFPLATTVTPSTPTTPSATPGTCSGTTYKLKSGDTCRSVSTSQNIGTAWLLYDNDLPAFCADFPTEGEVLCIKNKCDTHVIASNETCVSIAADHKISQVQLYTWNPILGDGCASFKKLMGDSICVAPPGDDEYSTPTTSAPVTETPEPTAAPVPSTISNGTNENCAEFYLVQSGDYCNLLLIKFQLSLDDFLFLNQGVNENCTNLYLDESYCVRPVGPIDEYPGHSGNVPTETISEVPFSGLPKATFTAPSITGLPTHSPLAKKTRKDCYIYADGTDLQVDMSYSFDFSACEVLAKVWGVSIEELQTWNPSLQTNSTECAMDKEYRYCMQAYDQSSYTRTMPSEPTLTLLPIREGTVKECLKYQAVVAPSTCENPSVGPECQTMQLGFRYCVKADEKPTSTKTSDGPASSATATTSANPTKPSAPAPTMDGTTQDCVKWHVVKDGDDCDTVAKEHSIARDKFHEWNTAVSKDCLEGFWLGYAYCVGV